MINIDELEALAKEATPGPWGVVETELDYHLLSHPHDKVGKHIQRRIFTDWAHPQAKAPVGVVNHSTGVSKPNEPPHQFVSIRSEDAALIAAANPSTILELIERVRDAESKARAQAASLAISEALERTAGEAFAEGRRNGLEDAARIAEDFHISKHGAYEAVEAIVQSIRAMKGCE